MRRDGRWLALRQLDRANFFSPSEKRVLDARLDRRVH